MRICGHGGTMPFFRTELGAKQTAAEQPVLLTVNEENPNGASVRFLVEGAGMPGDPAAYQRLVLLFDGDDPEALETARARWAKAKNEGFEVTYWRPDENGRWQRQA